MAKFAVIDHASHNILGEYSTEEQAHELYDRLVTADPSVETDVEIRVIEDAEAPSLAAEVTLERA